VTVARLTIALDTTYSVGDRLTGVGVYSNEIVAGLASAHPDERFLCCYRPHRFLRSFSRRLPANCHRRLLWESRPHRGADLFHGLNQRLPEAPYRRRVATFHDLFMLTSDYSTREFRERFTRLARRAADRADLIIAVSRFTAGQVTDLLGVEASRVRVVPHGVHPPSPGEETEREKMILNVGAIQHRKNIIRLVSAFERVPPQWKLVLAGSEGYGAGEILDRIHRSPRRADIHVLGYVSGEKLRDLYSRASIFAFPSLGEGFGIPVLEAMAWGTPVVTSRTSALPEATGDAAVLVDPLNEEEITAAILSLIENRDLWRELRSRGYRRAAQFGWDRAVETTAAVYRELLDQSSSTAIFKARRNL